MAVSMALPTWSAQLASRRPLNCNSRRPSRGCWVISMGASLHDFAAAEQFRRNDHAHLRGGGGVKSVFYLFDEQKRDARRRLAAQYARRDFRRRDAAVVKIPRDGHERTGLRLARRETDHREASALRGLHDADKTR